MGYRSSVVYTIRFHPRSGNLFYTFLAEAKTKTETQGCFAELVTTNTTSYEGLQIIDEGDKKQINFKAYDVKWYENYDDVKCHMSLLNLAEQYVNDEANSITEEFSDTNILGELKTSTHPVCVLGYMYARIGESDDDVETMESGDYDYDWLSVVRKIEADF